MFSQSTYSRRRDQLRQTMSGVVLLMGNDEVGMNYAGNVYSFRQDSTFLYYFGIDQPGLAAVINCDTGEDAVYGDELTVEDVVWTGPQESLVAKAVSAGINNVHPFNSIDKLFANGNEIHLLKPYRYRHQVRLAQAMNCMPAQVVEKVSTQLIKSIVAQRSIKEDQEVAALDEAVSISTKMHERAMQIARPGMTEREVMAEVMKVALSKGVRASFPPIVSVRGEVLHNQTFDNVLQDGQLLLVDCGGENAMHYAGDMTRTFPVSGSYTDKQRDIYQIVLDAEKNAASALEPGKPFIENHFLAAKTIVDGLKDVGLMKGNTDDAVREGAHTLFFPHGLGHMMGLDVHDMENYGEDYVGYDDSLKKSTEFGTSFLRLGKKLVPGNVLTVEPGIYFIPALANQWRKENKYTDFINYDLVSTYENFGGVRIEEDFLITEDGSRLLGDPLVKEVDDVEQMRSK